MRLSEVREQYTATEVAAWVEHLPPGSAVHRATDPAWRHTDELEMQRWMLLRLGQLVWQNGGGSGEQPELLRFSWESDPDAGEKPDSMTTEELADWLDDDALREALGLKR